MSADKPAEGVIASPPVGRHVAIYSASGVPTQILALERATSLDLLVFFQALVAEVGVEGLANQEGRTTEHFLNDAIGPVALGVAEIDWVGISKWAASVADARSIGMVPPAPSVKVISDLAKSAAYR